MNGSATGRILTCSGASQKGNTHLVSSNKNAVNLSNVPNIALWITTGVFFSPSLSVYSSLNLLGNKKSSWHVDKVTSGPTAGLTSTSSLGP